MSLSSNAIQDALPELNINGQIYQVADTVPLSTTLLEYLRDYASLKGTKGCCYEGGCGVCTVVASFTDQETGKEKTCSVKSCQTLVHSCTGWAIETIERLGDRYRGYHSLQKALVGFYGTQCGFCSPGFVMAIYGQLKSSGKLTIEQVEKSLDGNICRCTGYRPILDAFKSLAVDAPTNLSKRLIDIEDSYKATCPKTGDICVGKCSVDKLTTNGCASVKIPQRQFMGTDAKLVIDNHVWHRPLTLNQLYETLQKAPPSASLRFVVGNTGSGVYKNDGPFDTYLDITGIPELYTLAIGNPLVIGANVSLQRCIQVFQETSEQFPGYKHLKELATHWQNVANTSIRNVASWAGNLMMKNKHPEFPSDIFVTLAVAGAVVKVGHSADSSISEVTVEELVKLDMSKNVILSMELFPESETSIIRTFKISPRAVNARAYVNAAFKFHLDSKDGFKVLSKPTLIYGGINSSFVHASETEEFLSNRRLSVEGIVKNALKLLGKEIVPDQNPLDTSPEYRIRLSQALFYKFILGILGDVVTSKFQSGGSLLQRPLSKGRQSFDLNDDTWPVGQAIPKIESNIQVAGEAEFVDDMDPVNGELFGVFVQSAVANATLGLVDPSEALKVSGVVSYIDAKDIPGLNSFFSTGDIDPIFVSSKISYAGQSIGLVVATSKTIARKAAKLVKVEYKDIKQPILTIKEALKEDIPPSEPFDDAVHTIEGEFEHGSQFHFHMEPISARVIPVEDGYNVFCTTQWPDFVQSNVAEALGIKNNSINIAVRRLGGGFGGKISRPNLVACAAAVASHKLQKPVRITLDLTSNMTLTGWRDPFLTKYKVGFNDDGTIQRVNSRLIGDAGHVSNESSAFAANATPSVYFAKGWGLSNTTVNTNTAANTYCRTPGTPTAIASMENIIERVALFLKKDPVEIREKNFIDMSSGKTTQANAPRGENLVKTKIFPLLKEQASYDARRKSVEEFNKANRWKKRGLSMLPLYYNLGFPNSFRYNTQVVIYASDGTVVLSHGGIEMGQGLNTKAAQVAAKVLNVPLNYIKVKPTNNVTGANSIVTGGSFGSDLVAHGIQRCCEKLRKRMDVIFDQIKEKTKTSPTWLELVKACLHSDVDLSERFWTASNTHPESYDIFAAACMEVEVDVLTGQFLLLRTDIVEDCGRSLSPYVDIGQIEGAFIMGLGLFVSEGVKFDPKTGQKLSNGTWTYKPPTALDIPTDLRITLLPKADNKGGVMRSKATGEPALCLSYCVVTALRDAIKSAREDGGNTDWFEINTPLTVEAIQQLCKVDAKDFNLKTSEETGKSAEEEQDFHIVNKVDVPDTNEANCNLN